LMVLTVISASRAYAQDSVFTFSNFSTLNPFNKSLSPRAKKVVQYNEYTETGFEEGDFYANPLLLDGETLDFNAFSFMTEGELTVVKGAPETRKTTQVPFYIYLRREGREVRIPGTDRYQEHIKIEISEILKHSEVGDHLIIEAVKKEDGRVKRILKVVGGC
jgi:hypothetical protein